MWQSNSKSKNSLFIMFVDIIIINISIILAFLIRFNFSLPDYNFQPYIELFIWISMGGIFFLNFYHLYSVSPRTRWDDQFYSIILAIALNLLFSIAISYITANYSFPRSVFVISGLLQSVLLIGWRYFLWKFIKKSFGVQKAVIIGSLDDSLDLADRFNKFSESHIEIIGVITNGGKEDYQQRTDYPTLGTLEQIEVALEKLNYDVAVVTPSLEVNIKEKVVCCCYDAGKEVFLIPELYEVLLIKADFNLIDDLPIFSIRDNNGDSDLLKRSLDILMAAIGLIISFPIMFLVAIIIKLDSPGPIIYKQERVTKGGKLFTLYKFRTMVKDAEAKSGPVFAIEDDQRATRIGRILRLSRLDELPQFFNILKGDMSMVGPRPERPFFVERFSKEINGYEHRHRLKPGVTGIAQIAGKYNTGPREKLVFDLLYAKKNNVLVDLQIVLHTIKILFMRDKAS
jgi:exopolysaccharide biosynthesis polyprenyl glycosylphosphotransferase